MRRVVLAVAAMAMIAVPFAMPSGSSTVARSNVSAPGTHQQLVADRLGSSSAPSAHYLAWRQHVAATRYATWRHQVAHQRYVAWQHRVARTRYVAWRHRVALAAAARVAPTNTTLKSSTVTRTPVVSAPRTIRGSRTGVATWYAWHPGQCASSYRPKGSRIWVTNLATGKTISCVVTDSQPYSPNRVVDLNETQFAQLAPLWRGVVRVRVTW